MKSTTALKELWSTTYGRRTQLFTASILSVVGSCGTVATPYILNELFQKIGNQEPVLKTVLLMIAVIVFSAAVNSIESYIVLRISEDVVCDIRKSAVTQLTELEIDEFSRRPHGDLVSRVTTDTMTLRGAFTSGIVESIGNVALIIGCFIAMMLLSLPLTLISVFILLVSLLVMMLLTRGMRDITSQMQDALGKVANQLYRVVEAIRSIRAAGATSTERSLVFRNIENVNFLGKRLARREALIAPLATTVLQLDLIVLLGAGGFLVNGDRMDSATLVTFLLYLMILFTPVASVGPTLSSLFRAAGAYDRISEFSSMKKENSPLNEKQRKKLRIREKPLASAIEFKNVCFRYPDSTKSPVDKGVTGKWALNNVSFRIPRKKLSVLIGPSGAGKSTVFSLLERFYQQNAGDILLNGVSVAEMGIDEVRSAISYVEQNAPLISGTLRENICLGIRDVDDKECVEVLERVGLMGLLDRLDAGLDSYIGEQGLMLSGGERQRIALGRALLANRQIMLLDESTSNVDEVNQSKLMDVLKECAKSKTVLLIAHRRALINAADYVVVLSEGSLVDSGMREELETRCELYRDLLASESNVETMSPDDELSEG